MITFTLSGSLQTQIKRQLDSIFPNQLISIQNVHKKLLSYHELLSLSNLDMNEFIYGEPADYEFMGVSLQSDYEVEKTIYISDMTKPIKSRNLEIGRETKNSNEDVYKRQGLCLLIGVARVFKYFSKIAFSLIDIFFAVFLLFIITTPPDISHLYHTYHSFIIT